MTRGPRGDVGDDDDDDDDDHHRDNSGVDGFAKS